MSFLRAKPVKRHCGEIKNAHIGTGAIIIPGTKIGAHSIIGAGAVVLRDIPANVVAVGNPARVIRSLNR
jgi:maltose O-acetyltransferase